LHGYDVSGSYRTVDNATLPKSQEPGQAVIVAIWRLVTLSILLIMVAAAAAYAVASLGERIYAARSEIAFDLRDLDWDASKQFLATQTVIAKSRYVLMPIASVFRLPVQDLETRLSVEIVGDSGVVRLQYADVSEGQALDITRRITARYLMALTEFEQLKPASRWVLSEAFLLDDPISPQPLRAAALGALAGLILSAGIVLIRVQLWPAR
jgi:capsular polysaccharide biosynthesis protein